MRLLLIEADPRTRARLEGAFGRERFIVDAIDECALATERLQHTDYDLIVVGQGPGCDGVDVCRRIRDARKDVPIIIVTEEGHDDCTRVLDAGADDCVVKPIELEEMMARARALLRRGRTRYLTSLLDYGPLSLDARAHVVTLHGVPLRLSVTEYRLLYFLMLHAESIVTRQQLIEHVWGGTLSPTSNTPDVYLSYLRQKLAPSGEALIHTIRGLGYMLKSEHAVSSLSMHSSN
jgi:DNA-binding response OmpR family regulator